MKTEFASAKRVALKKYTCNACEWIDALLPYDLSDYQMTLSELKEIVRARRNGWQITPGQTYIHAVAKDNGRFYVWRGLPAIHQICLKYNIYDYDD